MKNRKFVGLELWRWFNVSASKKFGYSLTIVAFFICHEYKYYNQKTCKHLLYLSYCPDSEYSCTKGNCYYAGQKLTVEIFGLRLINTLLFKKEVEILDEYEY